MLYFLVTTFSVGANFWLSAWADDALTKKNDNTTETMEYNKNRRDLRLGVYGAFGFAQGRINLIVRLSKGG